VAGVTFTIDPDELVGMRALAALGKTAISGAQPEAGADPDADAVRTARSLLDAALAGKLTDAGLPWAPSAEVVKQRAGAPDRSSSSRLRKDAAYVGAAAVLVVIWGGYARGWTWTGFQANGQLWDWLNLLLLPTVVAIIPVWIQYNKYIRRSLRAVYGALVAAATGFVLAGYLIPLRWTGFRGQTLWTWTELLLLPAVVTVTMALASMHVKPVAFLRSLRPYQRDVLAVLAVGWAVSVIGGYALRWRWTGYPGSTLWDWFQLLLLPLVFPAFLLPGLVNWLTGNAAKHSAAQPHNNTSDFHLASADPDAARDSYRQALSFCQQPASPDGSPKPACHLLLGGMRKHRRAAAGPAAKLS
jgi:hypothetical protein